MSDEQVINEFTKTVPFFLKDNGIKIQVSSPYQLDHVELSKISEKFEEAKVSLVDQLIGWTKGIKPTGIKYTEEMLMVGKRVMGIGRLSCEQGKHYLKPYPSLPFMITIKNREAVIQDLKSPLMMYQIMRFIGTCGMCYFLYRIINKMYSDWKDKRLRKKLLRDLEANERLMEAAPHQELPEHIMCVICYAHLRDVMLKPCKHICVCSQCAFRLDPQKCPICRHRIENIEQLLFS